MTHDAHETARPPDVPDEVSPPDDNGYAPAETAILGGLLDEAMGRDTEDGEEPDAVEDREPPVNEGQEEVEEMTDFAGTEEPAGTDDEALESVTPIVGVPAAGGVAAPAVIVGAGRVADETDVPGADTGVAGEVGLT